MAQYMESSTLNAAIILTRRKGIIVEIDNFTVEVYWTMSSVGYLYSRLNRHDMAELERDLREAVDAIDHGL